MTLAKKNTLFKWNQKRQKDFIQFKQTCNKHFVLHIYNPIELIQLKININDFAMETCFTQKYNSKKQLIAYYSKKMFGIKQNYNIYNKKIICYH